MVNISTLVKEYLDEKPFIQEGLYKGVISHSYLAQELTSYIGKRLNKKVKSGSVMMAIRRYSEKFSKKEFNQFKITGNMDITLKSNLCEITILKSPSLFSKVNKFYSMVDFNQGGILNIIQGNYEITIITNMSNRENVLKLLKDEKIEKIDSNLVALSLKYSKRYQDIPGQIFTFTRTLAWENINVIEYVSTLTESIFILREKDALNAYNAFQDLIKKSKKVKVFL